MSITKCPHMMIHRHPGDAKMAGVLLIVVNGVGKIFIQYLTYTNIWDSYSTRYIWVCVKYAPKKKQTYLLTSQLGGLDEDSTLMIALSWCLDRMTVSCSAKLVIIRDESQSFSSLINTSASAPWHSLTHIYSHVSICQNSMGWNRESMHFKQRWPQLLLILFTYLYMLSAGLQRQKWNS